MGTEAPIATYNATDDTDIGQQPLRTAFSL